MSYLEINDLNLDKHLSVAIAATFAISVSHLHDNPVLKNCLNKILRWNHCAIEELQELTKLSWNIVTCATDFDCFVESFSSAFDGSIESFNSAGDAKFPLSYVASVSADYAIATAASLNSAYIEFSNSAINATVSSDYVDSKYIHYLIVSLLTLIVDYKVNVSKRPFKSAEKILDLLEDKDKQLLIFNLDILT